MKAKTIISVLDSYEVVDIQYAGGSEYHVPVSVMRQLFRAINTLGVEADRAHIPSPYAPTVDEQSFLVKALSEGAGAIDQSCNNRCLLSDGCDCAVYSEFLRTLADRFAAAPAATHENGDGV